MEYIKVKYRNAELNISMDEDEHLQFQNPMSGAWGDSIQQCFQGWTEKSEDDATDWVILQMEIEKKCDTIKQLIYANVGEIKIFK